MLFPLLWYVDGRCTIKIVEMADKSLCLKVRNNPHFFFKISFLQKMKHTKCQMALLGSPSSDHGMKVAVNHKLP